MQADRDYVATPNGHYFVKASVRKGLLPEILESLLQQRAKAKNGAPNAPNVHVCFLDADAVPQT